MGDSIIMKFNNPKIASFLLISLFLVLTVALLYPFADRLYRHYTGVRYYTYNPSKPLEVKIDTSDMPPAISVPIIMYHGIVDHLDEENTHLNRFIEHMEMLKEEGYQTISVRELENYFNGSFILPPKPIIITFDDGRKDSFFPVDDILKKLNFKATIFVATVKANHNDKFYLTWDELKEMQGNGRWEIEAHGRNSHERIPIDSDGNLGRFLTALQYIPGKEIETPEEFEARVEQDYINGIKDIEDYLGITPKYFAVPLNDYGQEPISYLPSTEVNERLTRKYFTFAFIEANGYTDVTEVARSFYNFKTDNPYTLRRLEMKNMPVLVFKEILLAWAPKPSSLSLSTGNSQLLFESAQLQYGEIQVDKEGLHIIATAENPSAVVTFGENYWEDYAVTVGVRRIRGQSIVLLGRYTDKDNFVAYGLTDKGLFLRETINGEIIERVTPISVEYMQGEQLWLTLAFKGKAVTGYLDGKQLFRSIPLTHSAGRVGVKVWDEEGEGHGLLESITVKPI